MTPLALATRFGAVTLGVAVVILTAMLATTQASAGLLVLMGVVVTALLVAPLVVHRVRASPGHLPLNAAQSAALVALYAVFVSGLVFRVRTAAELSSTPVDSAGGIRLLADAVAFSAAVVSLTLGGRPERFPFRSGVVSYSCYVAIVALGIVRAVAPAVVLFRLIELVLALLVILAIVRAFPISAQRPMRQVELFLWALGLSVLLGALVFPGAALVPSGSAIIPFRLQGVVPALSANTVGSLGVLFFAIGLGAEVVRRRCVAMGLLLVLLSQYRTGYVALAVTLAVYLAIKRSIGGLLATFVFCGLLVLAVQTPQFNAAWQRGDQSDSVSTLSNRTDFWRVGLEVTERSPFIGTGLSSGTRFEVLANRLGRETTSTIHGTWIEAYVGTGLLGIAALALALVFGIAAGLRLAARGIRLPLLLLAGLCVRSITGTTFELANFNLIIFLLLCVYTTVDQWQHKRVAETQEVTFTRRGARIKG